MEHRRRRVFPCLDPRHAADRGAGSVDHRRGLPVRGVPWVPSTWRLTRVALLVICGGLLLRYLVWRYQATLPPISEPLNWLAGWGFFIIETLGLTSALLSLFFLSRVRDRSAEADAHEGWEREAGAVPPIDVLICTYNEEQRILEHTILGALGMDYPNFRTWVLDDGRRPWLRALCERLGAGYITRPDNAGAKAGNINHALAELGEAARSAAVHRHS